MMSAGAQSAKMATALTSVLFIAGFITAKLTPSLVTPTSTCQLSLDWLESRSSKAWNAAADGIIAKLKAAGVQRGQIISIDAHNNGPDGDAIFSAYFSRSLRGYGPLDITYSVQNTDAYGWATFYNVAGSGKTEDLIGITGSSNTGGSAVTYAFSYSPAATNADTAMVKWEESRAGSWNSAADAIIAKLKAAGVQRGQIISIDAHNNGPDAEAMFSAHYDSLAPGYGPLDITYSVQNTDAYGWTTFYDTATATASAANVISITSSSNTGGSGVTYVFSHA